MRGKAPPKLETAQEALDGPFLDAAAGALETAASGVLSGAPELARDLLFDAAVSARAQAAPRLSSMLRALSRQAALAATRDVAFHPDAFLRDAARAYALTVALRRSPGDAALTGALRRDYAAHDALELHILGATAWRTLAGARGLRVYAYAPALKRWLSAGPARAAGADPSFEPRQAYGGALWAAGSIADSVGRVLRLNAPRISADGQIAADGRAEILDPAAPFDQRPFENALHRDWLAARADLAERIGGGLRRATRPEPILIAPARFGAIGFDDVAQRYRIEAIDQRGESLPLELGPEDDAAPRRMRAIGRRLKAVLAEATVDGERLRLAPIALLGEGEGRLRVWNLGLDHPTRADLLGATPWRRKIEKTSDAASALRRLDPLQRLAAAALELAVETARGAQPPAVARLRAEAESLGLAQLARMIGRARAGDVPSALRLAYMAGEIQAAACLR